MSEGYTIEGQKLVYGRSPNRKWKKGVDVEADILPKAPLLDRDSLYDQKMLTPAAMEKLLKQYGEDTGILEELVDVGEKSYDVAPKSSKKAEVVINMSAKLAE